MSRLQTLVKVAVVTGGASGLGAAIAHKLAMAGVKEVRVLEARNVPDIAPLSQFASAFGYSKSREEKREERQRSRVPQKMQSMAAKARR